MRHRLEQLLLRLLLSHMGGIDLDPENNLVVGLG